MSDFSVAVYVVAGAFLITGIVLGILSRRHIASETRTNSRLKRWLSYTSKKMRESLTSEGRTLYTLCTVFVVIGLVFAVIASVITVLTVTSGLLR